MRRSSSSDTLIRVGGKCRKQSAGSPSLQHEEAKHEQWAWLTLERAAAHLSLTVTALRKTLERRATRASDGVTEAKLDGVHARKFGRLWRVRFSSAWGMPQIAPNDGMEVSHGDS